MIVNYILYITMVNYHIYVIIKVVKIKSADFICRSLMKYWIDTVPSCPDFDDLRWDGCLEKKNFYLECVKAQRSIVYILYYTTFPPLYKENLHKELPISPWALFYIQYLSLKSSISLRIKTYFRCIDLGFLQVLTWTFIKNNPLIQKLATL